jgi:hypothetical protein
MTRYAFEELGHWPSLSTFRLFKPPAYAPNVLEKFPVFQQPLIAVRTLHDDLGMTVTQILNRSRLDLIAALNKLKSVECNAPIPSPSS